MPSLRDWAVQYARSGIPVFPLAPRGKMPLLPFIQGGRGFRDATTDARQIELWWDMCPDANIGGTPLVRDGLQQVVIDIDVQHSGDTTWNGLLKKYSHLPETLVARTGQGGQHIWLWTAQKGRGKLGQGVDCKYGSNGYVVLPPSVHPLTGRQYAWETVHPVAVAPDWVRMLIKEFPRAAGTHRSASRDGCGLVRFVESAPEGQRNSRLFWAACRAIGSESFARLERSLEDAALGVGLGEDEIRRVFESAGRRAR
jgi:hypothetical protein